MPRTPLFPLSRQSLACSFHIHNRPEVGAVSTKVRIDGAEIESTILTMFTDVHITLPVFSVAFVLSEDRISFAILAIVSGLSELPAGSKVCSGKVSVLSNS